MIRVFILINLLLPLSLLSQEENWDTYMWQYEKGPGSMLVNMSVKEAAPVKEQYFLLATGVRYKNCRTDGLPSPGEFDKLYDISDSVKALIDRRVKNNKMVATFTYQCIRLDYYYLNDTLALRQQLLTLYKKQFPGYSPVISIKPDSSWSTYLDFLYPNENIYEYMQDQKVVMYLKKEGDDSGKERQIDHWLYFKSDNDRKCMFEYLAANKFLIESMEENDQKDYPFSLHISRNDKAELSVISQVTKGLRQQAKKCEGVYDGWESPVVK